MSSVRLSSESSDGIPVLDLFAAKEDECAAAATIRQACTTAGFFSVCNHGVSQDLIDSTFSKSRDFFRQPRKAKESCRVDHNSRGWTPLGEETLDPATQSRGDTKEGFYIGREVAADSDEGQLPLQGPNNWPDEERWPALAGWREHMMEYHTALTRLGHRLVPLLARALGLQRDALQGPGFFDKPVATLRLLHYTAEKSSLDEGVIACGAHSDYGILTLLATDHVPGLQIFTGSGAQDKAWKDVPYRPGHFVVNIGDMLQRWSNDVFVSTLHRVVNTTGQERYSIPFFFDCNFDCEIKVFPECCTERPAKYKPIISGRHLMDMYGKTHAHYDEEEALAKGAVSNPST
eukprot:m.390759 g.390759  ORF g.390759 m.390759 type:complete len:347 (-) comp21063_c0_seq8:397-1437(-)